MTENQNTTGRSVHQSLKSLEDAVECFLHDIGEMQKRGDHPQTGHRVLLKDADLVIGKLEAALMAHKGVAEFVPRRSYEATTKPGTGGRDMEIEEKHESYGLVQINRVQGGMKLWGSSVHHQHFFRLTIKRGKRVLNDYTEHYWDDGRVPIVEVNLSAAQFVDLMAGMNSGSGTPCTISAVEGVQMDSVPEDVGTVIKVIVGEFARKLKDMTSKLGGLDRDLEELLAKKSQTKDDKAKIQEVVHNAYRLISDSAPYLLKQVGEHSENIVAKGKQEIDSFIQIALRAAGIKSIADAGGRLMLSEDLTKKIGEGGS